MAHLDAGKISVEISLNSAKFIKGINAANVNINKLKANLDKTKQSMAGVEGVLGGASSSLNNFSSTVMRSGQSVRTLSTAMQKMSTSSFSVASGTENLRRAVLSIGVAAKRSAGKLAVLVAKLGLLATVTTALIFKIGKLVAEFETIDLMLVKVTGSSDRAAEAFGFVVKQSNRLGTSLKEGLEAYIKFEAIAANTGMSVKNSRKIFVGFSEEMATLGLNAERTKLSFLALTQMLSKQTVSMEELRRQLGESLPTAMGSMAKALGVTTKELIKMVSAGEVLAEDSLVKLADFYGAQNVEAVKRLEGSINVTINRLANSWFLLKRTFTQNDVLKESLSIVFKELQGILDGLIPTAKTLGNELVFWVPVMISGLSSMISLAKGFGKVFSTFIYPVIKGVTAALTGMLAVVAKVVDGIMKAVDLVKKFLPDNSSGQATGTIFKFSSIGTDDIGAKLNAIKLESIAAAASVTTFNGSIERTADTMAKVADQIDVITSKELLNTFEEMFNFGAEGLRSFGEAILDFSKGADDAFKNFVNSAMDQLLKLVYELLVVQPLLNALADSMNKAGSLSVGGGGGGGGLFSSMLSIASSFLGGGQGLKKFASGGVISEPVAGVGLNSGASYAIGEKGPEKVSPVGSPSDGGETSGSAVNTVNLNINAIDSKSFVDLLNQNPQAILGPLNEAFSMGNRTLNASVRKAIS